jgi:myosin heavy subunit
MADQPNIFDDQQPAPTQEPVKPNTTDSGANYADLLNGIKNESGTPKYDSVPKALEALAHSQQFIPQLKADLQSKEAEIAQLKAQLAQSQSVEEVVSRLTQQQQAQVRDVPTQASGLDEAAITNLVKSVLSQTKQQESAQVNVTKVQEALTAKYGDKATEVLEAKARELGTTRQELGALASRNPNMVLALFGTQAAPAAKPTTGSVNIPASYVPERQPLSRPEKSLLSGATSKDQTEFMRKVKEEVYAKHGIQN